MPEEATATTEPTTEAPPSMEADPLEGLLDGGEDGATSDDLLEQAAPEEVGEVAEEATETPETDAEAEEPAETEAEAEQEQETETETQEASESEEAEEYVLSPEQMAAFMRFQESEAAAELQAPAESETAETSAETAPAPSFAPPAIPEYQISDEVAEQIGFTDGKLAARLLREHGQNIANLVHESLVASMQSQVMAQQSQSFAPLYVVQKFIDDNPQYESTPSAIMVAINEAKKANPNLGQRDTMAEAKKILEANFAVKKRIAAAKKVDVRPARGKNAPTGTNTRSGRPTAPDSKVPLDPTAEAFADIESLDDQTLSPLFS